MAEWLSGFPPYAMGAGVVHRKQKYLFGGWERSRIYNGTWKLTPGGWLLASGVSPWQARCYFSSVSFKGRIWILGGFNSQFGRTKVCKDIWTSRNGTKWEQMDDPPWEAREHYGLVVHEGRMVLLGGCSYGPSFFHAMSDVWAYDESWECLTDNAPWGPRRGFGAVVYRNRIWVFGGFDSEGGLYNDVWSSADGIEWQLETRHAPWGSRGNFASGVFRGRIWLLGGNCIEKGVAGLDDVWAYDGEWKLIAENPGWERRTGSQLYTNGEMTLVGGFTRRNVFRDAWTSSDGETWVKDL